MFDKCHPETAFALNAARLSIQLAQQVQKEMIGPALSKSDKSPVTVADFAVQALVGCLLSEAFPSDPLVAEESAKALQAREQDGTLNQITRFVARFLPRADPPSVCRWIDRGTDSGGLRPPLVGRFWALDPIDGTKGFLRGDQYAVALALLENGKVQIGVLGCPNLNADARPKVGCPGAVVVAVRGQGTWIGPANAEDQFRRLQVSSRSDPSQARMLRSFEAAHTNTDETAELARALGVKAAPVLMDSQAKYAVLAAGHAELLFRLISPTRPDYREQIWDQAAGALVVEEAGGRISDLAVRPLDFSAGRTLANNRGVLVSNGHLHAAALAALKKIEAGSPA